MPIDWAMAAVPTALGIAATTSLFHLCRKGIQWYRLRTRGSVCLKWEGIPDGLVHDRTRYVQDFENCLSRVFNRAWRSSDHSRKYAEQVPEKLPLGYQYYCSDARTVVAFIMSIDSVFEAEWNRHAKVLTAFPGITFDVVDRDTTIVYIKGPGIYDDPALTKLELERLTKGYPPWYREQCTTKNKVQVPFPIFSERDIFRAGWILAVGMVETIGTSAPHSPPSCYISPVELEKNRMHRGRYSGDGFRLAIRRCADHICKNIQPQFPSNSYVQEAVAALEYLLAYRTASGMGAHWLESDLGTAGFPYLEGSDVEFVFANFNGFTELQDADKARLAPIIPTTMLAAVVGATKVVEYLKDSGQELQLPPALLPLEKEVWLRIDP